MNTIVAVVLLITFTNGKVEPVTPHTSLYECVVMGESYVMQAADRSYRCIDNQSGNQIKAVDHESS